ncbi:ankyrin repeat domain-containing protein [Flavobacterium sp. SUN052]|uniref:ankyrin repeat domain-containing protein n=1 Tax=Flavobacterium sp. SUN052 TaxID=3002441 RepID=UPI00237E40C7|nr:ankyrin repeat domain-containing protein [Flavobacterium sp. SUN052]MEC4003914.1 ankyrin repeat domain-containing protein [Flavobacterium sp. SUN052]
MKNFLLILLFVFNCGFSQNKDCFNVARKGTLDEIKVLVKENPKVVNSVNDRGSSMLILACYTGNNEVAKFLLENNCDVNYVSDNGTALMAAVVKGNIEMVKFILSKKANVNLTDTNGITALIYAVQFKNVEIIKLLLQNNADKKIIDKNGKTAFEYAVFSGNEEIINLLK